MHAVHDRGVKCLRRPIERFLKLPKHIAIPLVKLVVEFFQFTPGRIVATFRVPLERIDLFVIDIYSGSGRGSTWVIGLPIPVSITNFAEAIIMPDLEVVAKIRRRLSRSRGPRPFALADDKVESLFCAVQIMDRVYLHPS